MVEIIRCDRPSGHAGSLPRPQCCEEGCTRGALTRDRCSAHYQSWRKSPEFVPAPAALPFVPPAVPLCSWCGPYRPAPGASAGICPTCGLDEGEIAYTERILADSTAVWIEETRAFNAQRRNR